MADLKIVTGKSVGKVTVFPTSMRICGDFSNSLNQISWIVFRRGSFDPVTHQFVLSLQIINTEQFAILCLLLRNPFAITALSSVAGFFVRR